MCDYSIEAYRSRPARAGERYIVTRFATGSVGFALPGDCSTAVCVAYDTRLSLRGIPPELQDRLGVSAHEEVTFIEVARGQYRDGVKFGNGIEVSLQVLTPGITAQVSDRLQHSVAVPAATELATV